MMTDDLWTADGPSFADLEVLESLAHHRRGLERIKPQNEHQDSVRNRLLSLLDEMEDLLCEEGHEAPQLAESWERVDELEALYWQIGEAPAEKSQPSKSDQPKPRTQPQAAASPPGRKPETVLARIDDCRPPAASCERVAQPEDHRKAA